MAYSDDLPDQISPFLSLDDCLAAEPLAKRLGVSEVARSERGFMTQYKQARGHPERLSDYWIIRREGFIARHMAQVRERGESLYKEDGTPTRRHLALIMWAYSPDWENK